MLSRPLLTAVLLAASPAMADVTADQVWADWQRLASAAGTPLTALAKTEGNRLVLSRLALALGTPDDPATLRLDRLTLETRPDGTVAVVLPASFPLTLDLPPPQGPDDPSRLTFTATAPGLAISIAGLGDLAAFNITAPSLTVTLDPLDLPAAAKADYAADLTFAAADLSLRHRQDLTATAPIISTNFTLGTLHADTLVALPEGEGGSFTVDLSALAGAFDLQAPPDSLTKTSPNLPDLLQGMSATDGLRASFSHGPFAFTARLADPAPGPQDIALTSASGAATLRADKAGLLVDLTSGLTSFDITIDDPEVPFTAAAFGYDDLSYGVSVNFGTLSGPEPFTVSARLSAFSFSEALWQQIDPASVFPRDPLSFALALSGRYAVKPEALAPNWQPASTNDLPVDIVALSLDELLLSAVGAKLTGTGALTFDNSDLVTFDGMPAPTGLLNFAATGINALIDRAASAGLIPPDELTPLRFGLAFIAKPGDGPDTLTSSIEFRDKSLYLNGQKLR
ncbi:DUF2125 domain-containing protein [Tabrizicola sp.]|uniref:DUF2125 domain-containing protein n=1 Tax=Tabrizicola sp. TaxID=2005166 RepID=UPI00286A41B6|nr:DUF2125 domain-containing protein [Tabrizicola sp.]